jgi:hypothetical protein
MAVWFGLVGGWEWQNLTCLAPQQRMIAQQKSRQKRRNSMRELIGGQKHPLGVILAHSESKGNRKKAAMPR